MKNASQPQCSDAEALKDQIITGSVETVGTLINDAACDRDRILIASSIASLTLGMLYSVKGEDDFDLFLKDLVGLIKEDPLPLLTCKPERLN